MPAADPGNPPPPPPPAHGPLGGRLPRWRFLRREVLKAKVLYAMLRDHAGGRYRVSGWAVGVLVAAAAYVLWPIDLIPDFIPVLGYLDEVVAVMLVWGLLRKEVRKYVAWRAAWDAGYTEVQAELYGGGNPVPPA